MINMFEKFKKFGTGGWPYIHTYIRIWQVDNDIKPGKKTPPLLASLGAQSEQKVGLKDARGLRRGARGKNNILALHKLRV